MWLPTAVQAVVEMHDTSLSVVLAAAPAVGGYSIVHVVPSPAAATGRSAIWPTAMQTVAAGQDTRLS